MVSFYTELCLYWSQFNELYSIVCTIWIITISCGLNICKILYIVAHFHFSIVKWQSINVTKLLQCYKIVAEGDYFYCYTLPNESKHTSTSSINLTTYPQVIHIVIHIIVDYPYFLVSYNYQMTLHSHPVNASFQHLHQ